LGNCQDLNISKIKQNHENFIGRCDSDYKSLSAKAAWCTKVVARQGLETWKHQQSAEENPQDGYNCLATIGSGRPRSAHSSGGPRAQSGGQAKKLTRFCLKLPFSTQVCTG